MRSLLLLAPLVLLAVPSSASANSCNSYQPFVTSTYEMQGSCKLVVYAPATYDLQTTALQTEKDGVYGTLDAPSTRTPFELDVQLDEWDDQCVESIHVEKKPFWRYELDVSSVPVGTEVRTPGGAVKIVAEGACTEIEMPFLYCQEPIQDTCWGDDIDAPEDDGGGCNAGGSGGSINLWAGLAIGLLVLGARRRRVLAR